LPNPPEWFCDGWWSPWCVIDEYLHKWFKPADEDGSVDPLPGLLVWVCDRHETAILRSVGEDPTLYIEEDRRRRERRRQIRKRARRVRRYRKKG
jgi:hypothetical protein